VEGVAADLATAAIGTVIAKCEIADAPSTSNWGILQGEAFCQDACNE